MVESSFYQQSTMPDLITGQVEPQIPETIGPYRIESLFSKGGMSLLYLGIHPETREPLIVKVLSPAYVNHPEAVAQFLKEAEVIALTSHPNIVRWYGQGFWEKGLYIAMELIRGISLKQFIIQHSLSLKRALEITLQVAHALHHLHAHGVIHRDLKPENILITEEGEIKVIDFGIAQLHEDKLRKGFSASVIGTPSYMSPEQKENPHLLTFASDIYSLGIILYELILGKLSYGLISLTGVPKRLRAVVAKMLAVSPMERYQSISECIHEISTYLNTGTLEKEKPGTDQLKEIYEDLSKASLLLSPLSPPQWSPVDLGLAKGKGLQQLGLYYDFFSLQDNRFLVLLSAVASCQISSAISSGIIRGIVRSHFKHTTHSPKAPFDLVSFVSKLSALISQDSALAPFGFSALLLDPFRDLITYLSCGLPDLIHMPQGQMRMRRICSTNLLLGSNFTDALSATSNNWNPGDTLILHTLAMGTGEYSQEQEVLELKLEAAIKEQSLLSANRQAEAILKGLSFSGACELVVFPKVLVSIQRII